MNILITGGSSGLGKAIVNALSNFPENKIYFTFNKHAEEADKIVHGKKNVFAIKCDFTISDEILELEKSIETFDLDVLINNAYVGLPQGTYFHKTLADFYLKSFENNIIPVIRITQSAISGFRKKKFGKIINILSASLVNVPPLGYSMYASNKAYIMQLSKSWSNEYGKFNITSNCVSPDFMLTNLSETIDERVIEQLELNHPLKKLLTPEEVANTVLFIIETSQHLNGTNIVINAGQNMQ
jgi:NAD(P)-dependent dehydrogenase (short-subunit alcohol dehydrogenase family)